jgi:apolipoprotein D and lipocalin family protein
MPGYSYGMKPYRLLIPVLLAGAAVITLAAWSPFPGGPVGNKAAPEPAKPVELSRYLGLWYEIGRYENGFERGCEAVTAEYRPGANGLIQVINSCHLGAVDGPAKVAAGRAKIVPNSGGAKLKVSFFGPFFFGDYWVLDHDIDYTWSVVGEPSGRYLWLLARDAHPPSVVRDILFAKARELGYDPRRIRTTMQ